MNFASLLPFVAGGLVLSRRRLFGLASLPILPRGDAPAPHVARVRLNGRAHVVTCWPPGSWAALPECDRPGQSFPMSGDARFSIQPEE